MTTPLVSYHVTSVPATSFCPPDDGGSRLCQPRISTGAPGEYSAPGTAEGRAGTATAQSINYAFTVTVLATDAWFNPEFIRALEDRGKPVVIAEGSRERLDVTAIPMR